TANPGGPYTVAEGGSLALSGSTADTDGTVTSAVWDLDGEGSFGEAAGARGDETRLATTFSAAGLDNGPYTISLRATDNAGATTTTTVTVQVTNAAPTIRLSGNANADEGSVYTLTLGAVTDPGPDTVTRYVVDWGDGTVESFTTPGGKTHTYADDGPAP